MTTFEDLTAFQRALDLTVDVYTATEKFPRHERFGLIAQLRRASGSIVSNIAEGQGRLTYGEWRQLLSQARGSLYEVQAQLIVAHRLGYLDEASAEHLKKRARIAGKLLAGLITWVMKKEITTKRPSREKRLATSNQQQATTSSTDR